MTQAVDPSVTRAKFDREVAALRELESTLTARGWWIMGTEFPIAKVAFATVNMKPHVLTVAVEVDFTDYDLRPPSVRFVDPFEGRVLAAGEMLTRLPRRAVPAVGDWQEGAEQDAAAPIPIVELVQHYGLDQPGFLCLPGVREYHDHPAHSGDPWDLHRAGGEGRLFHILEAVWRYGAAPFVQLGFQVGMQLQQREVPA